MQFLFFFALMATEKKTEATTKQSGNRWITREEIINAKWMWFTDGGVYRGDMKLLDNGKISGYDHPNERTWELRTIAHGYPILEFYGEGHKKTRQFIIHILDSTGHWKLHGQGGILIQYK